MKTLPIVKTLIEAAHESANSIANRISDVRVAPIREAIAANCEVIYFALDGKQYRGRLRGRNRNFLLSFGAEQDRAIACRVFLDGDTDLLAN